MLGEHFTSPVFTAALELWVAARTDPELHRALGPLEQRIGRETHYKLRPQPLNEAAHWIQMVSAEWDDRLEALRRSLEKRGRTTP